MSSISSKVDCVELMHNSPLFHTKKKKSRSLVDTVAVCWCFVKLYFFLVESVVVWFSVELSRCQPKLLTLLFSLYEVKAAESLGITALTSKRPATVLGWIEQYLYKSVIYKRSYCFGVWKQYPLVNKVLLNWPLNSFLMWQERNSSLGLG